MWASLPRMFRGMRRHICIVSNSRIFVTNLDDEFDDNAMEQYE